MPTAPSGATGRAAAFLAAIALVVTGLTTVSVLTAEPARAHTQLVDSSPRAGEVLDDAPDEIILEFADELLDLGAFVLVVDTAETDWAASALVIERATARAALREGMPDGRYELRWQVVAEDGHPISGIIPFGVGAAGAVEAMDALDPAAATGVGGPGGTGETASPAGGILDWDPTGTLRLALVGIGGAAIGIVAFLLIRRRRA